MPDFGDRLIYLFVQCISCVVVSLILKLRYKFSSHVLRIVNASPHAFGAIVSFNRFNLVACETVGNLVSTRIDIRHTVNHNATVAKNFYFGTS